MGLLQEKYVDFMHQLDDFVRKNEDVERPSVLAVSKRKSLADIENIHRLGQVYFGESFVQELVEKSRKASPGIKWHFIGHLQSNKCAPLLSIPRLEAIQTVDSVKLAEKINKTCENLGRTIRVYVQVNVSEETTKCGVAVRNCINLIKFIVEECPKLHFVGLMAIGEKGNFNNFAHMRELREKISSAIKINRKIDLSMGMSSDFKEAILQGSDMVRIGCALFGEREKH